MATVERPCIGYSHIVHDVVHKVGNRRALSRSVFIGEAHNALLPNDELAGNTTTTI